MGVIKRGLLGGFSGKVANIVGGSWKGIAYMRSLPLSVANPRTVGQVTQRTKFGTISAFGSAIVAGWIQPLWNRFAVQASGFNDFVKANIEFVSDIGVITFAAMKMSIGKLLGLGFYEIISPPAATENEVTLQWNNNAGDGNALATDELYIVGYNATQQEFSNVKVSTRNGISDNIAFENDFVTNDVLHVWLVTRRVDGTIVSDSQYLTATVIA